MGEWDTVCRRFICRNCIYSIYKVNRSVLGKENCISCESELVLIEHIPIVEQSLYPTRKDYGLCDFLLCPQEVLFVVTSVGE